MQGSSIMLLAMPEVQKELGLSDEQKKEFGELHAQVAGTDAILVRELSGDAGPEPRGAREALRRGAEEV